MGMGAARQIAKGGRAAKGIKADGILMLAIAFRHRVKEVVVLIADAHRRGAAAQVLLRPGKRRRGLGGQLGLVPAMPQNNVRANGVNRIETPLVIEELPVLLVFGAARIARQPYFVNAALIVETAHHLVDPPGGAVIVHACKRTMKPAAKREQTRILGAPSTRLQIRGLRVIDIPKGTVDSG